MISSDQFSSRPADSIGQTNGHTHEQHYSFSQSSGESKLNHHPSPGVTTFITANIQRKKKKTSSATITHSFVYTPFPTNIHTVEIFPRSPFNSLRVYSPPPPSYPRTRKSNRLHPTFDGNKQTPPRDINTSGMSTLGKWSVQNKRSYDTGSQSVSTQPSLLLS